MDWFQAELPPVRTSFAADPGGRDEFLQVCLICPSAVNLLAVRAFAS